MTLIKHWTFEPDRLSQLDFALKDIKILDQTLIVRGDFHADL